MIKTEWITQKEAARLSGKTLKAIHQLTRLGRLKTKEMFGKRLVKREEVLTFKPKKAGRPATMNKICADTK